MNQDEVKFIQIISSGVRDAIKSGPAHDPSGTPYKSEHLYGLDSDGRIWYLELIDGSPSMDPAGWRRFSMRTAKDSE